MKATPKQQAELLALQQSDLQLARLAHASKNHPLRAKLSELEGRAADLERFVVGQSTRIKDAEKQAQEVEDQVGRVRVRKQVQQERLESGQVGIRDMSAVEHEILQIGARQDQLESELLERMEAIEAAQAQVEAAKAQIEALKADEAETTALLNKELEAPNQEAEETKERIAALRGSLPREIVGEYDRLRERQGPVVVLQLKDGMLVNSPVSLSRDEMDRALTTPEDELWVSDETGFLVARTAK